MLNPRRTEEAEEEAAELLSPHSCSLMTPKPAEVARSGRKRREKRVVAESEGNLDY